ncbi:MAG: TorD/DmsD family molecular chaperone [Bryobacteraceae bacterium]
MSEMRERLAQLYGELGQALLKPPEEQEAAIEYYRLFFNPMGSPCPLWQSVYEKTEGQPPQLFGDAHHRALGWYRRYGFEPSSKNEPADHLGLLLLFYAKLLADGEPAAVLEQFENEHLRWAQQFVEKLKLEARHPYFQQLAERLDENL